MSLCLSLCMWCVSVSVGVCVYVYFLYIRFVGLCVCVFVCVAKINVGCLLQSSLILFLRQGLSLSLKLLICLDWLARQLRGSSGLFPPVLRLQKYASVVWSLGPNLKLSWVCRRQFLWWSISPAPTTAFPCCWEEYQWIFILLSPFKLLCQDWVQI